MAKDKSGPHVTDVVAYHLASEQPALLADVSDAHSEEVLEKGGAKFPPELYLKAIYRPSEAFKRPSSSRCSRSMSIFFDLT